MNLKVREVKRDDNLAILQKNVSADSFSFATPSKSIRMFSSPGDTNLSSSSANEVTKRIDENVLESLESGSATRMTAEIRSQFISGKLNLVIFNLTMDQIPKPSLMRTFAQHLYASSDRTIFLPTVKVSLFKEQVLGRKTMKFSDSKFAAYVNMMKNLIEEIQAVGNNKAYFGTIPLVPIKFARQLVSLYHSKGINCFALDANTSDMLAHETDLRAILSEINQEMPLSSALIYACNLGFPRYERSTARADDFLSLFAYVDLIGTTFKQKKFSKPPPGAKIEPRFRVFSREKYSYNLLSESPISQSKVNFDNQIKQLKEAHHLRDLIGQEKIGTYLQTKSAVDELTFGKLESFAKQIKIS